jgi:deoxyribonuclease V
MFEEIKSEYEAIELQNQLRDSITQHIAFNENNIKKIAGVDLAYWRKSGEEYAVCCIIIMDYNTKEVLEKTHIVEKIVFPYIPGCLAFRELPIILKTVKTLDNEPDIYVFDGNGYLHPRHMGIATHAAIYLKKPTIGVAKNYYKIDDVEFIMPQNYNGAYTDIVINGEVYGRALRTCKDVKPIFISVGNYIDLDTTTEIVKRLVEKGSHIPIPTRLADIETHIWRTFYKSK